MRVLYHIFFRVIQRESGGTMRIGANSNCPCGSGLKYKKCCSRFHKGMLARNALELMKSRYSAYALSNAKYIIKTTHKNNGDYSDDREKWSQEILAFTKSRDFEKLEIIEFIDGETEAFVTFIATLSSEKMIEKSRFLKEENQWLYESGEFLEESDIRELNSNS